MLSLTSTALSRTTCETVSRNWAAIPGLLSPRINFRSAIPIFNNKIRYAGDDFNHKNKIH